MDNPSITVKFVDFWPTFDCRDNNFTRALRARRDVTVLEPGDRTVPDILFYSRCGHGEHYDYDCLKIYFTGENDFPDFNECDYAVSFYEDSVGGRNLRYPLYMFYEHDQAASPPRLDDRAALDRDFCSLVLSNSVTCDPRRLRLIDAVESYRPLAYGGSFRNNVGGRVDDKIRFIGGYRFNLALENSIVNGYVTEKIVEPFAAATIPLYWGSSAASADFNRDAFINIGDYDTPESFLKDLRRIDSSPEEYLKILRAPNRVGETAARFDSRLEEFLDGIAGSMRRHVCRFGEMRRIHDRNRMFITFESNKIMRAASRIIHFLQSK